MYGRYQAAAPPLLHIIRDTDKEQPLNQLKDVSSDEHRENGQEAVTPVSPAFSVAPTLRDIRRLVNEKDRWSSSTASGGNRAVSAQTTDEFKNYVSRYIRSVRWRGVLALVAGLFSQMLCWGLIMTYGTILAFYVRYLIPGVNETAIALAGAIPPFCLLALALPWGRLLDAGHHHLLNAAAGVLLTGGMVALAFTGGNEYDSGKYWAILLASIPVGIGQSIYFMAAPQMAKTWHPKHKGFAMGITNSGAAIGGVVWPLTFDRLVQVFGFRIGVGCLAGLGAVLSIYIAIFSVPAPDFKRHAIGRVNNLHTWWPTRAFRSKVFVIHVISMCFVYLGILTIPFFIEVWARRNRDISISEDVKTGTGIDMHRKGGRNLSVYLLITLNGCQLPGRLFGSTLCDKFRARLIHAIACFSAVIIIGSCWFEVTSFQGGLVFAALFGLCLGVMVSLPINDVQDMLGHERTHLLGQYAGAVYTCAAPFILGGAVISGALVQYFNVWIAPGAWAIGCFTICGALIVLGLSLKDDTGCFVSSNEDRGEVEHDSQCPTRVNSARFDIETGIGAPQAAHASAPTQSKDGTQHTLEEGGSY
ncbi:hypothetical protein LTR64_007419 [Lithohypha guttulata]|uniref:uncharacterized protein n=1 Tax=Lithohypha guttulata TaxID=1690604 RepID=UPI002DDF652E|nr:hypothetical protein LTR51_004022 [Lithohypha guttulata]